MQQHKCGTGGYSWTPPPTHTHTHPTTTPCASGQKKSLWGHCCTWFRLFQSCYHFRHMMERQVCDPDSDHHLPSTDEAPGSPSLFPSTHVYVCLQWWEERTLSLFLCVGFPLLSYSSVSLRERNTCDQRVSSMATESKGLHACSSAGCWHLLPPIRPLCFILKALSPTQEPERKIHCPCFFSCLLLPL